jgi:hypothetical protein
MEHINQRIWDNQGIGAEKLAPEMACRRENNFCLWMREPNWEHTAKCGISDQMHSALEQLLPSFLDLAVLNRMHSEFGRVG